MKRLNELGLDLNDENGATVIKDSFHARLRRVAMNHVLRDIKHHARIPLPKSYQLVGIADEGPAYEAAGYENVYILESGQIYGQNNLIYLGSFLTQQQHVFRIPVKQNQRGSRDNA